MSNQSRKSNNTRQKILEVARALFAQHGYAGLRLDEVAKGVGIRRPSLFYYFKDKPTLYKAVWSQAIEEQDAYLATYFMREDLTSSELLDVAIDGWVSYAFENRDFIYLALFAAASGRSPDFPRGVAMDTVHRWQQLINRGVEEGVFQDVPLVDCLSLLIGMTSFYLVTPGNDIPALNRDYRDDKEAFATRLRFLLRSLLVKPLNEHTNPET